MHHSLMILSGGRCEDCVGEGIPGWRFNVKVARVGEKGEDPGNEEEISTSPRSGYRDRSRAQRTQPCGSSPEATEPAHAGGSARSDADERALEDARLHPGPTGQDEESVLEVGHDICLAGVLLKRTPVPGWRSFLCGECGHPFELRTRDHKTPSGEDCPQCGEFVFPNSSREDIEGTMPPTYFG